MGKKKNLPIYENVEITGSGRTDAGVHARKMTAHFDTEKTIDCKQLAYKLNRILPNDIAVTEVKEVASDLHARFSAIARTYHYYIHTQKDPFLRNSSCELHYALDFDKMNEAAAKLLTYSDFGAFWYIENAKLAMEEGKLLYGGKYSAPDYEKMVMEDINLAIESTMIS